MERALEASPVLPHGYEDLHPLHLGPRVILVTLTVRPTAGQDVDGFRRDQERLTAEIRAVDPRFEHVFFRPG